MTREELGLRLDAYVAIRQTMGYAMRAERTLLQDFVRFVADRVPGEPIRAQAALDWACHAAGNRGAAGQTSRLSMARQFLLHLQVSCPETEVPEHSVLASPRRQPPYLFSDADVDAILAGARAVGPPGALRPHTLVAMIQVLANTGLRVGEAARLTMSDVQLEPQPSRLLVRQTKFRKTRIVPVHPTMAEVLRDYQRQRATLGYDGLSEAFFVSEQGSHLQLGNLARWFSRLIMRVGVQSPPGQRRPCLRNFRHTFAVRRLLTWYQEGVDVREMLPHLSVYLGHVRPQESYWYLTATPQLLGKAAERFQEYAGLGGQS